jgi:hypothetical protein
VTLDQNLPPAPSPLGRIITLKRRTKLSLGPHPAADGPVQHVQQQLHFTYFHNNNIVLENQQSGQLAPAVHTEPPAKVSSTTLSVFHRPSYGYHPSTLPQNPASQDYSTPRGSRDFYLKYRLGIIIFWPLEGHTYY